MKLPSWTSKSPDVQTGVFELLYIENRPTLIVIYSLVPVTLQPTNELSLDP